MTKCHAVPAKTIKLSYGSGPLGPPVVYRADPSGPSWVTAPAAGLFPHHFYEQRRLTVALFFSSIGVGRRKSDPRRMGMFIIISGFVHADVTIWR